jgi:alkylation response protein AidB-like acyl-CoA dehydrogenase
MRADLDSADVVAAARRLSPQIAATREEAERLRHLPASLVDLADAGLCRLYVPCATGGPELPPATAFEVIEVLSKADGSVG